MSEKTACIVDGSFGIYVPQRFAEKYSLTWDGVAREDWDILLAGPKEEGEDYWETWDCVLNQASYTDSSGDVWRLWQDDDLFAYTGNGDQWT